MKDLLSQKVVVVTGGASGIGRAICQAAAEAGARAVICADLQEEPREGGAWTAELVERAGAQAIYCPMDVRSSADIERVMDVAGSLGGVDAMVCNAGIAFAENILTTTQEEYRRLTGVNLDGAYFTAQAAARQMVDLGKPGSITLISSMGGILGSAATPVYSSTKGALRLLAASMADALGPSGVRVNAVCPGVIDTALAHDQDEKFERATAALIARTPLRRKAWPMEVGRVVVWLASDWASFVTGSSIPVDGGLSSVL
jgi:NAD(P)-dependent dehydrogenase (short-subunit alcohol dehydrogenase family)